MENIEAAAKEKHYALAKMEMPELEAIVVATRYDGADAATGSAALLAVADALARYGALDRSVLLLWYAARCSVVNANGVHRRTASSRKWKSGSITPTMV